MTSSCAAFAESVCALFTYSDRPETCFALEVEAPSPTSGAIQVGLRMIMNQQLLMENTQQFVNGFCDQSIGSGVKRNSM